MKINSKSISAILIAFALITSVNLMAQNGNGQGKYQGSECEYSGKHYHHKRYHHGNFIKTLDLSDEQEEQIESMRTSHMETLLPQKNKLKEKQARLNTLSTAKEVDMKAINSIIDEIGAIKIEMMKERVAHQQSVRKVLTDAQRIKFDMHRANHNRKGRGQGRGI